MLAVTTSEPVSAVPVELSWNKVGNEKKLTVGSENK
jgi:hypothetical protein